jgi:hypothetical protein
MGSKLGNFL